MRRLPPWLLDSGTCCKLTHSLVFVFTMQFACTDNSLFYCLPAFALCTLQHKFPPFTSALSTLSAPHFQRTSHRVQVTNSLSFSYCLFGSAAQIAFGCISPVLRKWTSFTHLLVVLFPGKCKLCHCVSLLAFVQLLHFCSLNCKILLALNSSTHIRDILVSFWMRQLGVLCSFLKAKRGRGKANQLKVWQLRRLVGCSYLFFFFLPHLLLLGVDCLRA